MNTWPVAAPAESRASARTAAVYVFIPMQEAGSGVSLEAQQKRLEGYLKAAGLRARKTFIETGASGAEPLEQRAYGAELLDMIGKGQVRHVVALQLDSLFPSAVDAVSGMSEWDKAGVALHLVDFCGQAINTASAAGRMFLEAADALVKLDCNRTAKRTAGALARRKRLGRLYGPTPYGYRDSGGELVPAQDERMVLEQMRQWRSEGVSLVAIANMLDATQIPRKRGGVKWYPSTVKKILDQQSSVVEDQPD